MEFLEGPESASCMQSEEDWQARTEQEDNYNDTTRAYTPVPERCSPRRPSRSPSPSRLRANLGRTRNRYVVYEGCKQLLALAAQEPLIIPDQAPDLPRPSLCTLSLLCFPLPSPLPQPPAHLTSAPHPCPSPSCQTLKTERTYRGARCRLSRSVWECANPSNWHAQANK